MVAVRIPPYTAVEHEILDSPAAVSLKGNARALLLEVIRAVKLNARISHFEKTPPSPCVFAFGTLRWEGISKNTFYSALGKLERRGFIRILKTPRGHPSEIQWSNAWRDYQPTDDGGVPKAATLDRNNDSVSVPETGTGVSQELGQQCTNDCDLSLRVNTQNNVKGDTGSRMLECEQAPKGCKSPFSVERPRCDDPEIPSDMFLEEAARITSHCHRVDGSEWRPPQQQYVSALVDRIVRLTGDEASINNWRLIVRRMSKTEHGTSALLDAIDRFDCEDRNGELDSLRRKGAALNERLRKACRILGIDLGNRTMPAHR